MALIGGQGGSRLPQWAEDSGIGHVASFVESQANLPRAKGRISELRASSYSLWANQWHILGLSFSTHKMVSLLSRSSLGRSEPE